MNHRTLLLDSHFDLDELRCDQGFNTTGAGSRQILSMAIHKAQKEAFVRVKPEASPLGPFGFVQLPGDRDLWVVPNTSFCAL